MSIPLFRIVVASKHTNCLARPYDARYDNAGARQTVKKGITTRCKRTAPALTRQNRCQTSIGASGFELSRIRSLDDVAETKITRDPYQKLKQTFVGTQFVSQK